MSEGKPRILVIGAGVNGSICAVGLFKAGVDVSLLARGERCAAIRREGVVIENPFTGVRVATKVPVIDRLEPDDLYDYILVVVRKNQVTGLLPVLAANRSPNVVFMINNAQGPDEYVAALGRERVMLGFVFGGGKREGDLIRGFQAKGLASPFGEIDGSLTPRLGRLIALLRGAGLKAKAERHIVDYLTVHAAGVAPFAVLLMKHGSDCRELARSREDLALLAATRRETVEVLRALGCRIVPPSEGVVTRLPRPVTVSFLRFFLKLRVAEYGGAWHCQQAPDEMRELAMELALLVERSGLPVPALRKVLAEFIA